MPNGVPFLICRKCGYRWLARKARKPVECPSCKSRYWEKQSAKKGAVAK